MPYKITYDPEAEALYLYLREAEVRHTEERGEDIVVDFGDQGVVGIEVLDIDADLSGVIREFGLNPHIQSFLKKLSAFYPEAKEAKKELALSLG